MLQTITALGVDNFIKLSHTVTDKNLNFLLQMFHQLLTNINILMNCYEPLHTQQTVCCIIQHIQYGPTLSKLPENKICLNLRNLGKRNEALTFRCRIKSRLPFAGIIRRLPYSTRFQDKG